MFERVSSISAPTWAAGGVFYHIYPIGFLSAPHENDRVSPPEPRLAELRRWYDHIAGLGVTALYIGPVFESLTHGYDTTDYFAIDRRLGDNDLFRTVVGELHERGIRIILDGVFNHTGREFFAFKDIREKGRESGYCDWYHINWGADSEFSDGFWYESFEGHQTLPELNLDNAAVRQYVFSVARTWLSQYSIDGWRLDVAHQITPQFWWEFRRECKTVNPDCFLLGELIKGDYRTWVAPDLLDSGTNYQLYYSTIKALNDHNLVDLGASAERSYNQEIGVYSGLSMVNFLGNHDVSRISSILQDPRKVAPAIIFLLTMPGIPCLYYGEEIGMDGFKEHGDADLRHPMLLPDQDWPDIGRGLYQLISQLAHNRRQHPALRFGSFMLLQSSPDHMVFSRQHASGWAVAGINIAEQTLNVEVPVAEAGIPDGTRFVTVLGESSHELTVKGGRLIIDIPGLWGCILVSV
jgi:glycosidase